MSASPTQKIDSVKKIAILRAGAVGDLIVSLPAITALRHVYPEAEIVLLGTDWQKDFIIKGRTVIDRVVVVPVTPNITADVSEDGDNLSQDAFFSRMEREHFDLAIHLQGNGISAVPFIKKLKAAITVGLACDRSAKPDRYLHYYYYQNEILRCLDVVQLVGALAATNGPVLNVLDKDREEVRVFLNVLNNKAYVVLHPFASDIRRTWNPYNYIDLARTLYQEGYQIVFSGSKKDEAELNDIVSQIEFPIVNTAGKTTLGGLVALLKNASLLIAPDTGPLHLACAIRTPTVGIYWAPNVINWAPLRRDIHHPVISWEMRCPLCGITPNSPYPFEPQTMCLHKRSFVESVTTGEVLNEAVTLLRQNRAEGDRQKRLIKESIKQPIL